MSSSSESDDDISQDQFETEVISANSTQITNAKDLNQVKLALINQIKETSNTSLSYRKSMKNIKWNDIKIPGYSSAMLEGMLNDIVKNTGYIRTLDEILVHYVNNQGKIELNSHPGKPVKPKAAHAMWYEDNKEKIDSKLLKENPDLKKNFFALLKVVHNKFEALPDKKKQVYLDKYESEKALYDEKMRNFLSTNKDLLQAAKSKTIKKVVMKVLTPMGLFRQEIGGNAAFKDVQDSWKLLPKADKLKYIKLVLNDESDIEKKVSKDEMKIVEEIDGPPKKPTAYSIFYNKFRETYKGDKISFAKRVGEAWRGLSEREKSENQKAHEKAMVEYSLQLEKYISSLPPSQQFTWKMKHKKDLPGAYLDSIKKEKVSFIKTESSMSENGSSPKKRPRNVLDDDDEEVVKSPKKSPTKSKKVKLLLPDYPSQTTAHFYLKTVHDGEEKKAKKAYKKLTQEEKKKLRKKMEEQRHQYVKDLSKFTGKMTPDEIKEYKESVAKFKAEQASQISWHKEKGTDDEHESGSETDSD